MFLTEFTAPQLKAIRRYLIQQQALTVELNDQIDTAIDHARPKTPPELRTLMDRLCRRRSSEMPSTYLTQKLDGYLTQLIQEIRSFLLREHPGLIADQIVTYGELLFSGIASDIYTYWDHADGVEGKTYTYEVWREFDDHGVRFCARLVPTLERDEAVELRSGQSWMMRQTVTLSIVA